MGRLPGDVEGVLRAALVGEFTVIDPTGTPITHPMIPLYDGDLLYVHSSVLFSRKLRHVRANPKVALAVTDPAAFTDGPFHRVLVQGDARVIDDDPHTCWERILPLWIEKEPAVQAFFAKRVALPLFWERALIEITPVRALLWRDGRTDRAPEVSEAVGTR